MGDQIIYLEKYIDSTTSLPAELNRILNSIKDLDERSDDLAAQIQENVEIVLKMAPASISTRKIGGGGGGVESEELSGLRAQIENDQRLLIQFAEEKVQLAVQGYDLLEQHLGQADLDIVHLEAELHAMGMGDLPGVSVGPDYSGGTFDEPAPKRAASRMRDVPSFDSFEQAAPADPKPRKTTITLNLSRQLSGFEAAAPGDAHTPGVDSLGAAASAGAVQKRPATTVRKAPTPTPQPVAPPSEGYQRNRRAAAAGVHAVAAEVAAMEEEGDLSPVGQQRGGGGGGMAAAAVAQQQHYQQQHQQQEQLQMMHVSVAATGPMHTQMQMQASGPAATHGRTSAEVAHMFQEREPLIPGLNHAADSTQAPGRLLTYLDINVGLIGRHAELYWPDDNLWYLIKIQGFDPVSRKASILYTTGEAEELSLDEIIKDGHMSLIHQQQR